MGADDFKVNSAVRSVLSRHWIDLTNVGFGAVNGTVRLTGTLRRLSSESDKSLLTENNVQQIETELRAIREVKRVYFDLNNWRKNENHQWTSVETESTEGNDEGN